MCGVKGLKLRLRWIYNFPCITKLNGWKSLFFNKRSFSNFKEFN